METAITFVNNYIKCIEDIENVVLPKFYPAIRKLYETDPHDLISPDMVLFSSEGYVWKLFLNECKKINLNR